MLAIPHYDVVSALLRDSRWGHNVMDSSVLPSREAALVHRMFIRLNPPEHDRLRAVVAGHFSKRAIQALERFIVRSSTSRLQMIASQGGGDLVAEFAFPVATETIARILGTRDLDHIQVREWARVLYAPVGPEASSQERLDKMQAAIAQQVGFFEERLIRPSPDAASAREDQGGILFTLKASIQNGEMDLEEAISTCLLLLFAGHATTVDLIATGLAILLRMPRLLDELQEPGMVAKVVEEVLRFDGPVHLSQRVALEPLCIGEHEVEEGEAVILLLGAANRDPQQFDFPDEFRVDRRSNHHVAFGAGLHFCIGAALARLEGATAFRAFSESQGSWHLLADKLVWRPSLLSRGLEQLLVTC